MLGNSRNEFSEETYGAYSLRKSANETNWERRGESRQEVRTSLEDRAELLPLLGGAELHPRAHLLGAKDSCSGKRCHPFSTVLSHPGISLLSNPTLKQDTESLTSGIFGGVDGV